MSIKCMNRDCEHHNTDDHPFCNRSTIELNKDGHCISKKNKKEDIHEDRWKK